MPQPLTVGNASQNGNHIKLPPHASGNLTLTIPSALVYDRPEVIANAVANTLDELLAGITPETCHGKLDWGNPVGQEQW